MTKLSKRPLEPEALGNYINNLWSAFTILGSKEDIRVLFRDLFTHTEYKMFAKRFEIARRLLAGESYEEIKRDLKVTAQTIAKVNNILSEKGEGFRKADAGLTKIEMRHIKRKQEYLKDLSTPGRRRLRNSNLLGRALTAGLVKIVDVHAGHEKRKSVEHKLIV